MPEPTSATTTALALSSASLLPFINGNILLGAVLGGVVITAESKNLTGAKRVYTMLVSTAVGYLIAPVVMELLPAPFNNAGLCGLISSVFALLILVKMLDWAKVSKLSDIWKVFRGGGSL